jgi:CRP-like cAMP-binding protein
MAAAGAGAMMGAGAAVHSRIGNSLANRSRFQSMASNKKGHVDMTLTDQATARKNKKRLGKMLSQEDIIDDDEEDDDDEDDEFLANQQDEANPPDSESEPPLDTEERERRRPSSLEKTDSFMNGPKDKPAGLSPSMTPGGRDAPKIDPELGYDPDRVKETKSRMDPKVFAAVTKVASIWNEDSHVIAGERKKIIAAKLAAGATPESLLSNSVTTGIKKKAFKAKKAVNDRRFVVDPRAKWKLYWDIVCGVFIVFSVIAIPYRLFFEARVSTMGMVLDYFIDILFFFDMIFSFRTGFFNKQGHLIMNPRRIFKSYIRTWFVVDFFSTIPLDTIIYTLFEVPKARLRTIKLIRILRLARLAKLAKLMTRGSIQLLLAMINPAILRLMSLMGVIMFVAHFLSCFWAAVNTCSYKYQYQDDEEVDEYTEFKYNVNYDVLGEVLPGTLISKCGNENSYPLWVSQYLAAFYWVIATMMAVGYGDIYGVTSAERTFAIFVEIVGAGCFGFIISTVTQIVETMSPQSRVKKHEMELLNEYSKFRNLPRSLHKRLVKHFEFMFSEKSVFDELSVLRRLPVSMRVDLTLAVHSTKLERLKTLFAGLDRHFTAEIILLLRPFHMRVGETIVNSNVVPDQIFVVNTGYLQVFRPTDKGEYVITGLMTDGSVMGLSAAYRSIAINYKLCAPVKTDMWFIETHELKMVLEFYEEDTAQFIGSNDVMYKVADECWRSEIIDIKGVRCKQLIIVEGVATDSTTVDHHLLAGTKVLQRNTGSVSAGLVKTIKLDPDDPTKTIESLETPAEILSRRILDPASRDKTIWDVCVGLLIIFSVAVVPLRLGFDLPATKPWVIIDWTTDVIFTIDIIVTFRSGYLDENNSLVTVPKMIKDNYLSLWFWIDLGSTVPIDKIVEAIIGGGGGGLRSLKLIRIVRLVRLLKLVKLLKIDMSAVEEVIELDETVQKTLRLFALLYGLAHFFGCFWNMATTVDPIYIHQNLTLFDDVEEVPLPDGYIGAQYWAFTTMTTVGYGDILPEEDGGRFYATTMMIIGATFFSFIVGSAAAIINNDKNGDKQVKERLVGMYDYCVDRGISRPLEKRLKRNLNFVLSERSPFEENYILDCLPSPLRCQLMMTVKKDCMDNIPIFHNRDLSFIGCTLQHMNPCLFAERDVLYYPFVGARGLYFITSGKVAKCAYAGQAAHSLRGLTDFKFQVVSLPYETGEFVGFEDHGADDPTTPMAGGIKKEDMMKDDENGAIALETTQVYYLTNEALTLILMRRPGVADTLIKSIRDEAAAQYKRRKAIADGMTEDDLRVKMKELNDESKSEELLKKEGLVWASLDSFSKFVRKRSMADGQFQVETELASDQITRPLLREYRNTQMSSDALESIIEMTKKKIERGEETVAEFEVDGEVMSPENMRRMSSNRSDSNGSFTKQGSERSSRRASNSCLIVDTLMANEQISNIMEVESSDLKSSGLSNSNSAYSDLSSADSFSPAAPIPIKNKGQRASLQMRSPLGHAQQTRKQTATMHSFGSFKSETGATEEDGSQSAVVTAIRKAGRRVSHVDPMMGNHGTAHGLTRNSPLVVKHTSVMRPMPRDGVKRQRTKMQSYSNLTLQINEAKIEEELGIYESDSQRFRAKANSDRVRDDDVAIK